jgi:hypothetical protein
VGGNHSYAAYTPDKKQFYVSVFLALVGLILYLLGVFGVIEGGFQTIAHYAF